MPIYSFNWPLIGHTSQKKYLQNAIQNGSSAHAYLFYGPRNVGKKITAELFGNALLCENPDTRPCGSCVHCLAFTRKNHPDVSRIRIMPGSGSISVDQIRECNRVLNLRPALGSYKIGYIYDADKMTIVAANALLKILEEPPQNVVIILVANAITYVPATVVSRCQLIKFNQLPEHDMREWIKSKQLDHEQAKVVLNLSLGRIGIAQKLLDDKLRSYHQMMRTVLQAIDANTLERLKMIESMIKTIKEEEPDSRAASIAKKTLAQLEYFELAIRDLLLIKMHRRAIANEPYFDKLTRIAQKFTLRQLYRFMNGLGDVRVSLAQNLNTQLVWENFFINI